MDLLPPLCTPTGDGAPHLGTERMLVVIPGFGGICVILATFPQLHVRPGPPLGLLPPQLCRLWCRDPEKRGSAVTHTPGTSPVLRPLRASPLLPVTWW